MKIKLMLAAMTGLSLSGCLSSGPFAPVNEPIFANSGTPTRVRHFRQINTDCSSVGYVSVAVTGAPRGGRIEVKREAAFPQYGAGNPRAHCNNRRVDGVAVYYTANRGFTGSDSFSVDVLWADGDRQPQVYTVQVRG